MASNRGLDSEKMKYKDNNRLSQKNMGVNNVITTVY